MPDLPDPLVELDILLAALPQGEAEAPLLTELDGFLAGTLIAPAPLAEEDWLPSIWSGEDGPPEGYVPPPRLVELVRARRAEIAGAFLMGGMRYMPVYDYDADGEPMWELWIHGFGWAVALWGDDWAGALDREKDEDLAAPLMGLMMLVAIERGMPAKRGEAAELAATAAGMIPYLVETVYRRRHGLPRVVMA